MLSNGFVPSLREKFTAIIWKVEVDEKSDVIAIETRDPSSHTASFSVLNYVTGEVYIKQKTTENSWWWGLDRMHGGSLFLHGYKSEGSPEHRGIIAWDAKTGAVQWQQFNTVLEDVSEQGLIARNPLVQGSKPDLLDPETGDLLQRAIESYQPIPRAIHFPKIQTPPYPNFIPEDVAGPVHHHTQSKIECWSFHEKTRTGFNQVLLISEGGSVLATENLASGIQKLNPEAFFVHKNHLFCIGQNNYEIISYAL